MLSSLIEGMRAAHWEEMEATWALTVDTICGAHLY